jgi:hypothetical protein
MRLGKKKRKQDRCREQGRKKGRKRVMISDKKYSNLTGSTCGKNINISETFDIMK